MANRRLWIVEKPLWWFGRQSAGLWRWAAKIWRRVLAFLRREATRLAVLCLYSAGGAIALFLWPASREWLGLNRSVDVALLAISLLWALMFLVWTHWEVLEKATTWLPVILASPLWIGPFLLVLGALSAVTTLLLTGSVVLTPIGSVAMLSGLFWVWWRRRHGITLRCTQRGCRFSDLELCYRCEHGAGYDRLIPSHLGLRYHRSTCGCKLPATRALRQRHKVQLPMECPRGHAVVLPDEAHLTKFIALVGASKAGKTCYLTMAVHQLLDSSSGAHPYKAVQFEAGRDLYDSKIRLLLRGHLPRPTELAEEDAWVLRMRGKPHGDWRLYLWDPCGEIFSGLEEFRFFGDLTGIIVLVDPLSLPGLGELKAKYEARCRASLGPADRVFDALQKNVRRYLRYGPSGKTDVPVAVVIGKAEIPEVNVRVGPDKIRAAGEDGSSLCRKFLEDGGIGGKISSLEHHFGRVRYFSSTALGRLPDEEELPEGQGGPPYQGDGLLDPLLWLTK
ncbi:MAG: hypothetical protein AAB403_18665 [Planctomycetota bacterium]